MTNDAIDHLRLENASLRSVIASLREKERKLEGDLRLLNYTVQCAAAWESAVSDKLNATYSAPTTMRTEIDAHEQFRKALDRLHEAGVVLGLKGIVR